MIGRSGHYYTTMHYISAFLASSSSRELVFSGFDLFHCDAAGVLSCDLYECVHAGLIFY